MPLNKFLWGAACCALFQAASADVGSDLVNACLDLTAAPYVNDGPPDPATLNVQILDGVIASVTWEGTGAAAATSCKVTLPHVDLTDLDIDVLNAETDQADLAPVVLKVPGFYFADCHNDQPRHAVAVSKNQPTGITIRTINSIAVGRACVQNYGMQ